MDGPVVLTERREVVKGVGVSRSSRCFDAIARVRTAGEGITRKIHAGPVCGRSRPAPQGSCGEGSHGPSASRRNNSRTPAKPQ